MKTVKKLVLGLIFGLFFSANTYAINWSTVPWFNLYDSGGVQQGVYVQRSDGADSIFYQNSVDTSNPISIYSLVCLDKEVAQNISSGNETNFYSQYKSSWPLVDGFQLSYSGGSIYVNIVDDNGNVRFNKKRIFWFDETPSGNHPDDYVFCGVIQYVYIAPGNSKSGLWVRKMDGYQYSGTKFIHGPMSFIGSSNLSNSFDPEFGVRVNTDGFISPQYSLNSWRIDFSSSQYDFFDVRRAGLVRDYVSLTGSTGQYGSSSLPFMYGTLEVKLPESNSGSTGSGTDYFSECTSFLDVGCYVKGTFNGFVDKAKSFFGGLWSWILPDFNINWNGTTSTCASYQGESGSGGTASVTVSSGSGSVGILQRFANFLSAVSPFPPPSGSTVCLLDGTTKTVTYVSSSINFFDIIVILICILPILFASHHSESPKK